MVVLAIISSSVSFVAETHSYFKDDPSCRPVLCDLMAMQADPTQCAEVNGCSYTYSACVVAAAGTCGVSELNDNRTACVTTPGCEHSSVASCVPPTFSACAGTCEFVAADTTAGTAEACEPPAGNCTYTAVQCEAKDMQLDQETCETDDACVYALGFCGADAVCSPEWPEELLSTASVSDSADDATRRTQCEATPGCFYSNTLSWMHLLEACCILLFTIEYILKLISSSQRPDAPPGKDGKPRNPLRSTLSWATETMSENTSKPHYTSIAIRGL